MTIEITESGESPIEAAATAATASADAVTRALLAKAQEFGLHMGAFHGDVHVTGEDIETEDTIRNTQRTG